MSNYGKGTPEKIIRELRAEVAAKSKRIGWMAKDQMEREDALKVELEKERMRLAACSTASLQNTDKTINDRLDPGNEFQSAAYQDVCAAVDREMALRKERDELKATNEAYESKGFTCGHDIRCRGLEVCRLKIVAANDRIERMQAAALAPAESKEG